MQDIIAEMLKQAVALHMNEEADTISGTLMEMFVSSVDKTHTFKNLPTDALRVYFIEPNYELMRQTILCEQIIAHGFASDFIHINVIPKENTELCKAVESEFIPMLKDKSKFRIIDPQELLAPLEGNEKYSKLLEYLRKRYW